MTSHLNASLASISVGGRTYPYTTAKGCRVCNSGSVRLEAENQIVSGRTWARIVEELPEEAGLSARNLKDHYSAGHMPIFAASVQEHLERASTVRGEEIGPAVERIADHLDFAQAVVGRVNERLVAGEVEPTVRDALSAADHLARYAPADTGYDEAGTVSALMAYHDAARAILDDEAWAEFGRRLRTNPTLNALLSQASDRRSGSRVHS